MQVLGPVPAIVSRDALRAELLELRMLFQKQLLAQMWGRPLVVSHLVLLQVGRRFIFVSKDVFVFANVVYYRMGRFILLVENVLSYGNIDPDFVVIK